MMVMICTFSSSSWLAMMSFMFTTLTASPPNPNGFTNASAPPPPVAALLGIIEGRAEWAADDDEEEGEARDEGSVSGDEEGSVSSAADDR